MNKARFKRMLQFIFNPVFLGIKNRTHRLKRKYSVALKKPILKNTVFFEAYLGESVTGNSLALFEEMYNNPKFKDFKFIWSVKNFKNVKLQYRKNKNVKFIIRDSKKFVNYLARSEYLITDTTFPHYFNKRKEQKYIMRSEEHTSELQSRGHIVCRLLLEKKKRQKRHQHLRVY